MTWPFCQRYTEIKNSSKQQNTSVQPTKSRQRHVHQFIVCGSYHQQHNINTVKQCRTKFGRSLTSTILQKCTKIFLYKLKETSLFVFFLRVIIIIIIIIIILFITENCNNVLRLLFCVCLFFLFMLLLMAVKCVISNDAYPSSLAAFCSRYW